ncbi:hypothetical protein G6F57_010170 [Rhizopus arrhizus]|uniref:Glutaminase n=1 Tax=Rhizopus oryzae TaxID=64495 RepID=A0A9P6X2I2_RHIOR|nr:hypothetical protein G6F23_006241 [Rhizopus arrhizus]KAG1413648.1 hypothetical protein G6F58_007373 [Rhizopus delemar]KAG0757742.1 hypothetical protein G6F24_010277 [Rhizopus arrhizus]KAG0783817.1 hypothetical protein G6F21_010303 [Rhizopus arrhizus]KAG0797476.1 hypothetical protein G6F22_004686 [Rhizopus arrhizus]
MTALQAEHIHMLNKLPQVKQAMAARTEKDLDRIHALIIPGGESTDCRTGVDCSNPFTIPLFFSWGTCAYMLLLAKEAHALCLLEEPLDAVFIRVPVISEIMSPKVGAGSVVWEPKVGQTEAETAVAVVQDDLLATAFHPELTRDDGLHQYKHVLQVIVIALY